MFFYLKKKYMLYIMNSDFKITQSGIYNYDTGTFLSFDRFQTKKGEWSVALKKRLKLWVVMI